MPCAQKRCLAIGHLLRPVAFYRAQALPNPIALSRGMRLVQCCRAAHPVIGNGAVGGMIGYKARCLPREAHALDGGAGIDLTQAKGGRAVILRCRTAKPRNRFWCIVKGAGAFRDRTAKRIANLILRRRMASARSINMGRISGLIARDIEAFIRRDGTTGQCHSTKQRQGTQRKSSG